MENIIVFSLSSSEELADQICEHLQIRRGKIKVDHFADGEILVEPDISVRGKNVYLVQSTSYPVSENYMEVLIALDAFKRASAKEVTVVSPYFGYARQDRKARARQPITAKLMADLLQAAGADRVVTLDLHAPQIQGFFDIPIDHLMSVKLLSDYFIEETDLDFDNVVVVSPDHGGVTRARKMADRLKTPIAIIDKRRPKPNVSEVMNIVGEIEGRTAIIIDDIIDTGGTIKQAAQALVDKGAKEVYACCTHPVLSGPAIERLDESIIKKVVVTNSIQLSDEKKIDKIEQLSIASLLAQAIVRVYEEESVSTLFD